MAEVGYGVGGYGSGTYSQVATSAPYLGYGTGGYGNSTYGQTRTPVPIRLRLRAVGAKVTVRALCEAL